MKAVSEFQMQRLDFEDWETASRDPQQSVVKIEIVDGAQEELIAG